MNIHTAKQFLPLVQALADGKTIQGCVDSVSGNWVDFETGSEVDFTDPPDHYRIKPEPFECWVLLFGDGSGGTKTYSSDKEAKQNLHIKSGRVAHMREVE